MDGIALYAALVATGNLLWTIWHAARSERFDVTVTTNVEAIVVGGDNYELTVTARNLGKTDEALERMGIRFYDPTAEEMAESSVSQRVESDLKPNRAVRFTVILGRQRYRVGREYQGFATLASGRTLESAWQELDGYSLDLVGLRELVIDVRQGPNLGPTKGRPAPEWQ